MEGVLIARQCVEKCGEMGRNVEMKRDSGAIVVFCCERTVTGYPDYSGSRSV